MIKKFKPLLNAAKMWNDDNAFSLSAAVSFYTLFSLAPISVIAVSIISFFMGKESANEQFSSQVTQLVGKESAEMIQQAMAASASESKSWAATVLGVILSIVGATTVFGELQGALNRIWSVKAKPTERGWIILILHRLVSFTMVLTIGFLLLVSLVLTTALAALTHHVNADWAPVVARLVDMGVGFAVITLLFAAMFKLLPDVKLRWKDVWSGAAIAAALFSIGRYLIALYLGKSTVASVYGAAGSLVALLVWVYYSCAILFYGVEYTRASLAARGIQVVPKEKAVMVREEIITPLPRR